MKACCASEGRSISTGLKHLIAIHTKSRLAIESVELLQWFAGQLSRRNRQQTAVHVTM